MHRLLLKNSRVASYVPLARSATISSRWSGLSHRPKTSMALRSANIIGDVVDDVKQSGVKLEVRFGTVHVDDGITLRPAQASATPTVHLHGTDQSALYTLIGSDPDPPDPQNPKFREWLHWMVTNVPGGPKADVKHGHTVTAYMGPAPPVGTHRYVFLAFKQLSSIEVEDPSHGEAMGRKQFNTRQFAQKHGLGDPVAATYFLSHK